MQRCDRLATISEEPGRLTRRFATPALAQAWEAVLSWMRDLGMTVRVDAIGNVVGRWEPSGPAKRTLLLGSHLNVRVGMEDNVFYRRGELLTDNAQLVRRTVRIAAELDRRPASPEEARALLGLRGREPGRLPEARGPLPSGVPA